MKYLISVVIFLICCSTPRSQKTDWPGRFPDKRPMSVFVLDDTPMENVRASVAWWNEQADRDGVERTWLTMADQRLPHYQITIKQSPLAPHLAGLARTFVLLGGRRIYKAEIELNDLLAWDNEYMRSTLKHELGHVICGLKDEPWHEDIKSIMSSMIIRGGILTERDFNRCIHGEEELLVY